MEMTESKAETASEPAKELLALNPKQESEFKKKVQEAKKKKSSKVRERERDMWARGHGTGLLRRLFTSGFLLS